FGPMLRVPDEQKAEYVRQAARILNDTALSPIEKAREIERIPGFGYSTATAMVMLFHPRDFSICNDRARPALARLGYPVEPIEVFERSAETLKQRLEAQDFLELDLYLVTHEPPASRAWIFQAN